MTKLAGKVAVVTGGSSGIGLAVAQEFVSQGAEVVIFGRNQGALDDAAARLGGRVLAVRGDVAELADLERLYRETALRFGGVDVLVANAGIAKPAPLEHMNEALFDEISGVNFKGAYFTVQKALPHLNDGASVILVTSVGNRQGVPAFSVYTATKAAIRSLTRSFAAELLPRGIRVNALSPGAIDTPIFGKLGLPEAAVEQMLTQVQQQIPLGRFGRPEEMAKATLFLASADSSYMVGAELVADGGETQL